MSDNQLYECNALHVVAHDACMTMSDSLYPLRRPQIAGKTAVRNLKQAKAPSPSKFLESQFLLSVEIVQNAV